MTENTDRDVEKSYPLADFVAKLRRFADALEAGERFDIQIDGERISVRPMSSVMIKPGCRHRALGKMRILNIAIPRFDPADEWFD